MENGKKEEKSTDIPTRAFELGVRIIKLCQFLDKQPGTCRTLASQLLRTGTSIGANVEEGRAAQSKADFIAKYSIALKEARETLYRLRLLTAAEVTPAARVQSLVDECSELCRVIGKALATARRRL
jgi:four helix bundle protein